MHKCLFVLLNLLIVFSTSSCYGNYTRRSGQISEKFEALKRPFNLKDGKVGIACRSELNGGEESVYQAIKNGGLTERVEFIERTEGLEEDDYFFKQGINHYKHCTIVYGK